MQILPHPECCNAISSLRLADAAPRLHSNDSGLWVAAHSVDWLTHSAVIFVFLSFSVHSLSFCPSRHLSAVHLRLCSVYSDVSYSFFFFIFYPAWTYHELAFVCLHCQLTVAKERLLHAARVYTYFHMDTIGCFWTLVFLLFGSLWSILWPTSVIRSHDAVSSCASLRIFLMLLNKAN